MPRIAMVLRYTAFTMMALFGLAGGLFLAGSTFDDPGGWAAVGMTAMWVAPMVGLSAFTLRRPATAGPFCVGLTTLVVVFAFVDSAVGIVPREWGPIAVVSVFALAVTLAFLGLHRPRLAGLLLVVTAVAQVAATTLALVAHESGAASGPGRLLSGSGGVLVVPLLVAGVLYLLAAAMDHESPQPGRTTRIHPAR